MDFATDEETAPLKGYLESKRTQTGTPDVKKYCVCLLFVGLLFGALSNSNVWNSITRGVNPDVKAEILNLREASGCINLVNGVCQPGNVAPVTIGGVKQCFVGGSSKTVCSGKKPTPTTATTRPLTYHGHGISNKLIFPPKNPPAPSNPCDPKLKYPDENSCEYYYSRNTAISLVPEKCPSGKRAEPLPPFWWGTCLHNNPDGKCSEGCGTCKKPNFSQGEKQCMCAGSANTPCNKSCGYPGQYSDKKCPLIPCQMEDKKAAGCVPLSEFSSLPDWNAGACSESNQCQAFCAQIIGTNKCETHHNKPWVTGKSICPKNAVSQETCPSSKSDLDPEFNRCPMPSGQPCPYLPDTQKCSPANGKKPKIYDKSLENIKIPDKICPSFKNRGSEGIPNLFTNLLVPADASVTCENACACNSNPGLGPSDCFYSGEGYPGPSGCCYCNGKNVAYDMNAYDTCGHYLPLFGPGVVPSQEACYEEYVKNPDHPGLVNNFPAPDKYICVATVSA